MFLSCVDHVDRSGRAGHAAGVDAHLWSVVDGGLLLQRESPVCVQSVWMITAWSVLLYTVNHITLQPDRLVIAPMRVSRSRRVETGETAVYSRSAVPLCHRSPYTLSSLAGASQVVSCAGLHRSTDSELDLVGSTLSPPAHKGFGQVHRDDAPRILEHELVGLLTGLDNVAHVRGELVHRPHLLDAVQRDEALLGRHRQ